MWKTQESCMQWKFEIQNISIQNKTMRWVEGVVFWYIFIYAVLKRMTYFVTEWQILYRIDIKSI
jgi:hypothetical protein